MGAYQMTHISTGYIAMEVCMSGVQAVLWSVLMSVLIKTEVYIFC